jgi:predicted nucleic acid-binding protein
VAVTLVDSNVLFDIFTKDHNWYRWSAESLAKAANEGILAINAIIYAEVSYRFETIEELEDALSTSDFNRLELPWEAAFLAAKCYKLYKKRGGARHSTLPDFYIGAHAAVKGFALLTRDARRYRTYFPKLEIISPE